MPPEAKKRFCRCHHRHHRLHRHHHYLHFDLHYHHRHQVHQDNDDDQVDQIFRGGSRGDPDPAALLKYEFASAPTKVLKLPSC